MDKNEAAYICSDLARLNAKPQIYMCFLIYSAACLKANLLKLILNDLVLADQWLIKAQACCNID